MIFADQGENLIVNVMDIHPGDLLQFAGETLTVDIVRLPPAKEVLTANPLVVLACSVTQDLDRVMGTTTIAFEANMKIQITRFYHGR